MGDFIGCNRFVFHFLSQTKGTIMKEKSIEQRFEEFRGYVALVREAIAKVTPMWQLQAGMGLMQVELVCIQTFHELTQSQQNELDQLQKELDSLRGVIES